MLPLLNSSVQYGYHPERVRSRKSAVKRRKQKRRVLWGVLSGVTVLCLAAAITMLLMYSGIRMRYCIELGEPVPSANVFSINETVPAAYITDVSSIDASVTGDHWVHILADGKDRAVILSVQDTIAPAAQPMEIDISVAQEVTPDQLVSNLTDAGAVNLQWEKAPAFGTVGDYPVVIKLRDMSGNVSTVTSMVHIRAVEDSVTCEAGSEPPSLAQFLIDDSINASFITDVASLPLDTPGDYTVDINVNGITYTSMLVVADTVGPQAVVKTVFIHPGESAAPEDFIASATDASALSYAFESAPDFNRIGAQDVGVLVTDLGGNIVRQSATLLISNVAPITVEARDTAVTAADFTVSGYASASLVTQLIPNTLGDHVVELLLDGQTNPTIVTVIDTTPPQGEGVDAQWYLSHPFSANRLVKREFDYTGITYTYAAEPDWANSNTQSVDIILTDAAGNATTVTSSLTLITDTQAPALYGVKDRYCYIGQAVAYFAEVFAEDNCDGEMSVDVDKSQVNINAAGTYPVTYTATDSSGNATRLSCKFTFIEETIADDQLFAAADEVLSEITTPDMSMGYKAYAIFQYVFGHIKYNGVSDKTDWKYEAYRGITTGRGDCFTFYATAKCLLERIGAQTMCVERHGGNRDTHHYWLLVNLGTGWYHFDAINVGPRNFECFMRTDKDLLARGANFWSFDESLYPPTPTENYVLQ